MKVLVLGAYGFIGSAITRDLVAAGHEVTGFGRKIGRAARQFPQVAWVARDLRMMRAPEDWRDLVAGMDGIVNAAGVLQDGADDDVAAVQSTAMQALFAACAQYGPRRIVQISAVGADSGASTRFMTTKAEADAALAASALDWIILRPGLVFGPSAYGATALLRALAAFPLIQPLALPGARVQTVALSDVVRATSMALEGHSPTRTRIDLVEDKIHSLEEVILALRAWHGLPPARTILAPDALVWLLARGGDALGRLGWRPPLRTTSVVALAASVTGDASVWRKIAGKPLSDLSATLRGMPSNAQEHWFARMWLAKPLVIGGLALFWLLSGIIGFWHFETASRVLTERGVAPAVAAVAVGLGSLIDCALGAAVLIRRWHVPALAGMLATSCAYLAAGTWLAPDLWGDPIGPFVKILPSMILCLVALAIDGDR